MTLRLAFSPEAIEDLRHVADYIAEQAGSARALAEIDRIEAWCRSLTDLPERGRRRDDIRPGLRVISFQRRMTIAFTVQSDRVIILRILAAGRDIQALLQSSDDPA